jgi:ABC-type nitrate/sulfonate/bicarbonate transport system substrate-binding protein
MRKYFLLLILLLVLSACGSSNVNKEEKLDQEIPMDIFLGLPVGFSQGLSGVLTKKLKENGIEANISYDTKDRTINFFSVTENDVVVASDLVGMIMLKDNDNWRILSRVLNLRVGLLVPPGSDIKSFADIKHKKVAGHATAINFIRDRAKKLDWDPSLDINFSPMESEKIRQVVLDSENNDWSGFDALIVCDSLLSYFQVKEIAELIDEDKIIFPVMTNNLYIQEHPEAMVKFFRGFVEAVKVFRKDMIRYKKFSIEGMPEDIEQEVYAMTYSQEENFDEEGVEPLRLYFNNKEIDYLQEVADMVFTYIAQKDLINITEYIDLSYMEKAMEK